MFSKWKSVPILLGSLEGYPGGTQCRRRRRGLLLIKAAKNIGMALENSPGTYSAVEASMSRRTAETRFAGMPVRLACSLTVASSGAR
jgi:hypothetical protein